MPSPMLLCALCLLLADASVGAGETPGPRPLFSTGSHGGSPHLSRHDGSAQRYQAERSRRDLENFSARKGLEARRALRAEARDAERAVTWEALRRRGTPESIERFRARARSEDFADDLAGRIEIDAVIRRRRAERGYALDFREIERRPGWSGGPTTFSVLERQRNELLASERSIELERKAGAAERGAATRAIEERKGRFSR